MCLGLCFGLGRSSQFASSHRTDCQTVFRSTGTCIRRISISAMVSRRGLLSAFADYTSAHGFSDVQRNLVSLFWKFIWLVSWHDSDMTYILDDREINFIVEKQPSRLEKPNDIYQTFVFATVCPVNSLINTSRLFQSALLLRGMSYGNEC